MDDQALQRIEADLYEIAEFLGQPEALSNRLYFQRTSDGAERRPMELRERLVEKIMTLDRMFALHDHTTYRKAMENIARATTVAGATAPERAVVLLTGDSGSDLEGKWNLANLPDLSEARSLLRSLIEDILGSNRE